MPYVALSKKIELSRDFASGVLSVLTELTREKVRVAIIVYKAGG